MSTTYAEIKEIKKLEVKCKWDSSIKRWVCVHCGKEPQTFYIVTGHDHTDYSIWYCKCRENINVHK